MSNPGVNKFECLRVDNEVAWDAQFDKKISITLFGADFEEFKKKYKWFAEVVLMLTKSTNRKKRDDETNMIYNNQL